MRRTVHLEVEPRHMTCDWVMFTAMYQGESFRWPVPDEWLDYLPPIGRDDHCALQLGVMGGVQFTLEHAVSVQMAPMPGPPDELLEHYRPRGADWWNEDMGSIYNHMARNTGES